jgi:hypothetical protein
MVYAAVLQSISNERLDMGRSKPSVYLVECHYRGAYWLDSDLGHSPTFSAEVKERVYIYLYSLFWAITTLSSANLSFGKEESETQIVVLHHCGDNRCADY